MGILADINVNVEEILVYPKGDDDDEWEEDEEAAQQARHQELLRLIERAESELAHRQTAAARFRPTGLSGNGRRRSRRGMKPSADPIEAAAGWLKDRIPPSDILRAHARADEERALARRVRHALRRRAAGADNSL
jgi:hypothetical protein